VDTIGPYKIKQKGSKTDVELQCLTMIDPATGWFEMTRIPNKLAHTIAQKTETTWLTRYPWPQRIICDRGTEFLGEFREMIINDYGIELSPITVRNPQANAILERIHQTIGNILRTFELQHSDGTDEIEGILAATMFAVRATYHTTLKTTPAQLVFGRDAILNIRFQADWHMIQQQKTKRIQKNNETENSKRKHYNYSIGQKIMILQDPSRKHGTNPYDGPYQMTHINKDGTVRVQIGPVQSTYNIRNIHPYNE
jgi:transposase InsO family protein